MDAELHDARILIVDDELVNTVLLERLLRSAGYGDVTRTTEPEDAPTRGAKDILTKPFRKDQIRLRVANLLHALIGDLD